MAQRVRIELTDDLVDDGTTADETVTFALDGVTYEIDLTSQNATKLRDAMAPWMAAGRRLAGQRRQTGRATARRTRGGAGSANEIRVWARANGYEVSDRGRVPADIQRAYDAAH